MLTGVPAATWLGQQLGWRSAYWTVVVAAATVAAVLAVVPSSPGRREATVRGELGALRRPQVILTLLVGIVGFGGMFALYSYIAPVATDVAGSPAAPCPWCCSSTAPGGRRRDGAGRPARRLALFRSLVGSLVVLFGLLAGGAHLAVGAGPVRRGLRVSVAASVLAITLQMRLMETAATHRCSAPPSTTRR
jgi:DHA1 family inner membrane transport protein